MKKTAILALVTGLALDASAFAGLQHVWGGVSYPAALGNNYVSLSQPMSYQAEVTAEPVFFGLQPRFSATLNPFSLKNVANARLYSLGFFAGLHAPAKLEKIPATLFMAFEVGGAYNWMTFPGTSSMNSSTKFALRLSQGVDVPLWGDLGAVVEVPISAVLGASSLWILSTSFSLRWKL